MPEERFSLDQMAQAVWDSQPSPDISENALSYGGDLIEVEHNPAEDVFLGYDVDTDEENLEDQDFLDATNFYYIGSNFDGRFSEGFSPVEGTQVMIRESNYSDFCAKWDGKYYSKTDKNVRYVRGKYYHIEDDTITETKRGYRLTKDVVKMWDGEYCDINQYGVVTTICGRKGVKGLNVVSHDGEYYTYEHEDVICLDKGGYIHKDDLVYVENSTHMSNFYTVSNRVCRCHMTGENFHVDDCYMIMTYEHGQVFINKLSAEKVVLHPVIVDIWDERTVYFDFKVTMEGHDNSDLVYSDRFEAFVPRGKKSDFHKRFVELSKARGYVEETKAIKDNGVKDGRVLLTPPIKDCGFYNEDENIAKRVFVSRRSITGGHTYFNPNPISSRPVYSQTLTKVGGKNYTLGIEIESFVGVVPDYILDMYGIKRVGDGSTRIYDKRDDRNFEHYEYVTAPMHGDNSVNKMYEFLPKIAKYILQNDKCSTHIHVGGQSHFDDRKSTDAPVFNREFSARCIKLGIQIEDSLAMLMPKTRDPKTNKYCGSIKQFRDYSTSSKSGIDRLIAAFVFGAPSLSSSTNSKTPSSRWSPCKYKWLNLMNCNSKNGRYRDNSFQTVEFRIFPPTTDPKKLHFYMLISLGFVWFVENRPKLIEKGGVTVEGMLKEAYGKKSIYSFIQESIEKYKRNDK